MTLTWRTLRDYALRFATFAAVTLAAVSIPMPPLFMAVYVMRYYWLAFVVSNASPITLAIIIVYVPLVFLLVFFGHHVRKDWLWRRFWIDVGR